jgi:hypothetical protein
MAGFGGAGLFAELVLVLLRRGETAVLEEEDDDDVDDADEAPGEGVVRRLMRERGTGVSLSELTTEEENKKKS